VALLLVILALFAFLGIASARARRPAQKPSAHSARSSRTASWWPGRQAASRTSARATRRSP